VPTPSELRQALADLNVLAARDLGRIWRALQDGDNAAEALHDILPGLIDKYGEAAGAVASDWYDDLRDSLGVGGRFAAIPADIKDSGAHALVGWALDTATDDGSLLALLEGGLQRRVINFGRFTVMGSSIADPKAEGWQRLGQGANCAFCDMLISRGAVYSEASADFGAHDHCNCVAVPAFDGHPRDVKPYTPSLRGSTDAERAAARAWIESH
jgi:hypothetical protein